MEGVQRGRQEKNYGAKNVKKKKKKKNQKKNQKIAILMLKLSNFD